MRRGVCGWHSNRRSSKGIRHRGDRQRTHHTNHLGGCQLGADAVRCARFRRDHRLVVSGCTRVTIAAKQHWATLPHLRGSERTARCGTSCTGSTFNSNADFPLDFSNQVSDAAVRIVDERLGPANGNDTDQLLEFLNKGHKADPLPRVQRRMAKRIRHSPAICSCCLAEWRIRTVTAERAAVYGYGHVSLWRWSGT